MDVVSHTIVLHAQQLAGEVAAQAVVIHADTIGGPDGLRLVLQAIDFRSILKLEGCQVGPHQAVPEQDVQHSC
jgi:hypothetical protein